jgi:hypothetical protein
MASEFEPGRLSEAERALRDRAAAGEVADFAGASSPPLIRAGFLSHLALQSPPRGIRLRGARIEGALDLSDASLPALLLEGCDIPEWLDLTAARLGRLSIKGSRFRHLAARGAALGGPFDFSGSGPLADEAWIDLGGASVAGGVDGCDAKLKSPRARPKEDVPPWDHNYALRLSTTDIRGNVLLNGGFVAEGGVSLDDAHVRGSVWARGATINAGEGDAFHPGDALHAHAARIDGFMGLNFGFNSRGRIWLLGTTIGDRLSIGLTTSHLAAVGEHYDWAGRALNSTVLLVIEQIEIGGSFHVMNCRIDGAVNMDHARIGADATFANCEIRNRTPDGRGIAITARSAEIAGDLVFGKALKAEGRVSLAGARIGRKLDCRGLDLDNRTEDGRGVALDAQWAEIGHGVAPADFPATASADVAVQGRIDFTNAKIG